MTSSNQNNEEKKCICNHSNPKDCYPKIRCACKVHGDFSEKERCLECGFSKSIDLPCQKSVSGAHRYKETHFTSSPEVPSCTHEHFSGLCNSCGLNMISSAEQREYERGEETAYENFRSYKEIPMGISRWITHGDKYGYSNFLVQKTLQSLKEKVGKMLRKTTDPFETMQEIRQEEIKDGWATADTKAGYNQAIKDFLTLLENEQI